MATMKKRFTELVKRHLLPAVSRPGPAVRGPSFERTLEQRKRESTVQLLFKCSRILQEQALGRVRARAGVAHLRPSHTALFPHVDLEGTRLTDLADRLSITKQAVGQLVEDLEQLGILERVPDPADGRAKLVRFTTKGRRGLLQGLGVLKELEEELSVPLGRHRMADLNEILQRLLAALEARGSRG
jgi:DNA-binding MarR family transcriptional regulator